MSTPSRSVPGPTVWEREEPARRAPLTPLHRDDVVAAAVELADADGLAAVSVRRVAAALGVGPMRLYRVFDTVEELHELMVDAVYGEVVDRLELKGGWRKRTRAILVRTRTVVLRHEWVADLLGTRPLLGPHGLAWLESTAEALRRAPAVSGTGTARAALGAVDAFLLGALRREVAELRAARPDGDEPGWHARTAPYLGRMLETGRFPTVRKLLTPGGEVDRDAVFRAEVDLLLAGLGRG